MTLAGLALAIGPLVDSAIICLENTHRHLSLGDNLHDSAFLGASEVAMPELVSSLCTFLVLAPLALMPGTGVFLFRPMAYAVAFAMIAAYVLSRSFVPSMSSLILKPHGHEGHASAARTDRPGLCRVGSGHRSGDCRLHSGARFRLWPTASGRLPRAWACWLRPLLILGPVLRRDFFPEVDAGAFEIYVRARTGHPHRTHRGADRQGRASDPQNAQERPRSLLSVRSASSPTGRPPTRPTPAPWTPSSKCSSRPSASTPRRNTSTMLRASLERQFPRSRIRVRCRRHDPRRDERGKVDAAQRAHPRQRHGQDPRRGRGHPARRSSRFPASSTRASCSGSIIPDS